MNAQAQPQRSGDEKVTPLDAARIAVKAKSDPGSAFETESLAFLRGLRTDNRAQYERTIADLKAHGVRTSELEKELDRGSGDQQEGPKLQQVQHILNVVEPAVDLFHDDSNTGYIRALVKGHKRVVRIQSPDGYRLIMSLFRAETSQFAQKESIKTAQDALDDAAKEGERRKVYLRVARSAGILYVDCCDDDYNAIRISPNGWEVVSCDDIPVTFGRKNGMLPLPLPQRGGNIADLGKHLNLCGVDEFRLYVAALTYAFNPRGPYPLVALFGEHGAAKSTGAIIYRNLIDPSSAALRSVPRNEDDLLVQALSCWLQVWDNVSKLSGETSDAMCRLLTGGGAGKRQLYTDSEQVLVNVMRPAVVTSIPDVAERHDLADRSITLACRPIPASERKPERVLWDAFEKDQPRLLGAVLDIVACGLREWPNVPTGGLARMADFHTWGRAIESMNGGPGTFDAAYEANRNNAVVVAIETDLLAYAILKLLRGLATDPATGKRHWTGSATDLRNILIEQAGDAAKLGQQPGFPKNPRALSEHLRRIQPTLRQIDVAVSHSRTEDGSFIVLSAVEGGKFASLSRMASAKPDAPDAPDARSSTLAGSEDAGEEWSETL